MGTTAQGYLCSKCGSIAGNAIIEVRRERRPRVKPVYAMEGTKAMKPIVNRDCPRCDSKEVYMTVLATQGEHAGVKQDRSFEKYTCVECCYIWVQ